MNWIDFTKERPKEEPKRQIWVHWVVDGKDYYDASDAGPFILTKPLHWAEIEPPGTSRWERIERDIWGESKPSLTSPKPDPFEEWWKSDWSEGRFRSKDTLNWSYAKAGWDAAIKYKEGK